MNRAGGELRHLRRQIGFQPMREDLFEAQDLQRDDMVPFLDCEVPGIRIS
jgi:hypothetical protein